MDYDDELHSAWVKQALQLAMDYREAEPGRDVWDVEEAMKWADTWGPTDGEPPTGDQLALATLARVVRAAGAELASMRQCFDAADRERSELRERAKRAEAERNALRAQQAEPVQRNEPSGYESITPAYTRWVSPARYAKFHDKVKRWYRPYWVPKEKQRAEPSAFDPVAAMRLADNVGAEPTAEAGADWPRRDDDNDGPERPGGACRSGSARARC